MKAWTQPPGSWPSLVALVLLALGSSSLAARETTIPPTALYENTPAVFALTNARIVVAPGRVIPRGTLVMRDGVIVAVGPKVHPPADAVIRDLNGYTIYPGFFDASTAIGLARGDSARGGGSGGSSGGGKGASYWNRHVTPEWRADVEFTPDADAAKKLREQGVTTALTAPTKGVIKGTSAVVALGEGPASQLVLVPRAALHVALTPIATWESLDYPTSAMGALALVRQAFLDADWYRRAQAAASRDPRLPRPETNVALAALEGYVGGGRKVVVDAQDELYLLRADRLGKELDLDVVVRGSGREYRRLEEVRAAGRPVIVPVNFPKPPRVETPEEAMNVPLEELLHWDIAPENPGRLARAGIPIALTSDGLEDRSKFLESVRRAVERGLEPDAALRALTVTPASLFGLSAKLGTLEPGKVANLVVTDGDVFAKKTKIWETWIDGRRYEVRPRPAVDARGTWALDFASGSGNPRGGEATVLTLSGQPDTLSGKVESPHEAKVRSAQLLGSRLALSVPGDAWEEDGVVRMSATVTGDEMLGEGEWPDGRFFRWTARRTAAFVPPPDTSHNEPPRMASFPAVRPLGAFGRKTAPEQPAAVAFRGATVWTCGPQGTLEDATVLVERGRIAAVGHKVNVPAGAQIVEAHGLHLTPGLVDCHSHTATDGGINEGGQTVTAEVRVGDFVDPDDINIYRQLAGGVTSAHILHGSANTIGGQCQLVKYRWGEGPEAMKFAGAQPTIKFALGENVKRSNWDGPGAERYPRTRMGVEQLLRDRFQAAREYQRAWREGKGPDGLPPRRDLELDALVEVLEGKRNIHCHSYRQDEIMMFMRVCDDFGIRNVTFQHILEGYKVADELARRKFGASAFSDWWAYKAEVYDAIPYAGTLMHDAGVVVSFNSDSDELARRLNTEAGKAVKYGGVSPEEALRFVTLNPAKQLQVENRVGTLEVGKDADVAVWDGPPLSPLSRCEQTWVDGRKYFDRSEDAATRRRADSERAALIQKILRSGERPKDKEDVKRAYVPPRTDLFEGHGTDGEDMP